MGTKTSELSAVLGSALATSDKILVVANGVSSYVTVTELFSGLCLLGVPLADVAGPYADQAAAATAITGTGKLWYQTTTGLLGITLT
jgi:hypothetical protein